MQIFREIPFIKVQNNTQQLNGEKQWKMRWRAKPVTCVWLSYVVFVSSAGNNVGMTVMCNWCANEQHSLESFMCLDLVLEC